MDMVRNNAQVFKRCPIGTKGPKVCQENIPTALHHHQQLHIYIYIYNVQFSYTTKNPNARMKANI